MTIHAVKCWPDQYRAIEAGYKTGEFRRNDRGYKTLDYLHLREWNPGTEQYTGSQMMTRIQHVGRPDDGFGIPDGMVVLSIRVLK